MIELAAALAGVVERWGPQELAALNDREVKVARFHGEFVWRSHGDKDNLFLPSPTASRPEHAQTH